MRELSSKPQCYSFLGRGQGRWRRGQIRSGKYWVLSQREGKAFKVLLASLAPIRRSPQRRLKRISVWSIKETQEWRGLGYKCKDAKSMTGWKGLSPWWHLLSKTSVHSCTLPGPGGQFARWSLSMPMVKHGKKKRIIHRFLTGTRLFKHSAYVSPG